MRKPKTEPVVEHRPIPKKWNAKKHVKPSRVRRRERRAQERAHSPEPAKPVKSRPTWGDVFAGLNITFTKGKRF